MGRPTKLPDAAVISISTGKAKSRLQSDSERRAIVNLIIDHGGSMTLLEIVESFGYNIRPAVHALIRDNWLETKK